RTGRGASWCRPRRRQGSCAHRSGGLRGLPDAPSVPRPAPLPAPPHRKPLLMRTHPLTAAASLPALTDRIGRTPLLPIGGLEGIPAGVSVAGKAEWFNPGGSVKDRAAWAIIQAAEAAGGLTNRRLLDATSGNTGIAYAWIGAARGHRVTLCLP